VSWLRIDDGMAEHPKLRRLPHPAWRLHLTALMHASRYGTDGVITHEDVEHMTDGRAWHEDDPDGLVELLVHAGLWEVGAGEHEGLWRLHDYHDYNPPAEQAKVRRERVSKVRSQAGLAGNHRRHHVAKGVVSDDCPLCVSAGEDRNLANGSQPVASDARTSSPRPVPSRPVPFESDAHAPLADDTLPGLEVEAPEPVKASKGRGRRKPETPLPEDWTPTDAHREQARQLGIDVEREAVRFRAHAEANDRRQREWNAAFRLWLDRAPQMGGARPAAGDRVQRLAGGDAARAERLAANPWLLNG
jgi:hypothetical protein